MQIRSFHHPDICPTVVRRRVSDELLTLLLDTKALIPTWNTPSMWASYFPNRRAYRAALSRLRKQGLIAYRRTGGKVPMLKITEEGEARAQDVCRRTKPWPLRWNGAWYLLSYDVPETHRSYREHLRSFLKEKRMGCLHKSAWITPHDIRSVYDDLVTAAGVDQFSFLLEAKTVLGRSPSDIVKTAWNMERLRKQQMWYMDVYQDNLDRAASGRVSKDALQAMIREEQVAYTTVMSKDPLLPKSLWPKAYAGEAAWLFHRTFLRKIASLL